MRGRERDGGVERKWRKKDIMGKRERKERRQIDSVNDSLNNHIIEKVCNKVVYNSVLVV